MTCIVALSHDNNIYMGGDRSASDGDSIVSMSRPKINIKDQWIFGYAGNIGLGQLIEFISFPTLKEDDDPYMILRLHIVEELKRYIETHGDAESDDAHWLIGCKGRLFELSSDGWGVIEVNQSSIGSGTPYALGSLYTSIDNDPIDRIGMALGSAITYSPTCQAPVDILYI